jgi:hypothetical protein
MADPLPPPGGAAGGLGAGRLSAPVPAGPRPEWPVFLQDLGFPMVHVAGPLGATAWPAGPTDPSSQMLTRPDPVSRRPTGRDLGR